MSNGPIFVKKRTYSIWIEGDQWMMRCKCNSDESINVNIYKQRRKFTNITLKKRKRVHEIRAFITDATRQTDAVFFPAQLRSFIGQFLAANYEWERNTAHQTVNYSVWIIHQCIQ